jgi:hypothetical protein
VYRQHDFLIEGVTLDGRSAAGVPVASSPLMLSSCGSGTIVGLDAQFAAFGFAVAMWRQTEVVRFTDCVLRNSRKIVNIEQAEDGAEVEFVRPVLDAGPGYFAQVSTRGSTARAKLTVLDPVGDGPVPVKVYGPAANSSEGGNGMQTDDIRVFVRGKLATSQRLKLVAA